MISIDKLIVIVVISIFIIMNIFLYKDRGHKIFKRKCDTEVIIKNKVDGKIEKTKLKKCRWVRDYKYKNSYNIFDLRR